MIDYGVCVCLPCLLFGFVVTFCCYVVTLPRYTILLLRLRLLFVVDFTLPALRWYARYVVGYDFERVCYVCYALLCYVLIPSCVPVGCGYDFGSTVTLTHTFGLDCCALRVCARDCALRAFGGCLVAVGYVTLVDFRGWFDLRFTFGWIARLPHVYYTFGTLL